MAQLLLIPDARPLEQRLGREFSHKTPRRPGVYLMKDAADNVVYVGKSKDLRQRLSNYRVANPDRMPRRHLRMVREVKRIEFHCARTNRQRWRAKRSCCGRSSRNSIGPGSGPAKPGSSCGGSGESGSK